MPLPGTILDHISDPVDASEIPLTQHHLGRTSILENSQQRYFR